MDASAPRIRSRRRLEKIDDALIDASAIEELQLVQERRDLNAELESMDAGVDLSELEDAFVGVAEAYGERKGISYGSWRDVGVSAATLEARRHHPRELTGDRPHHDGPRRSGAHSSCRFRRARPDRVEPMRQSSATTSTVTGNDTSLCSDAVTVC